MASIKSFKLGNLPNMNHYPYVLMVSQRAQEDEAINTRFSPIVNALTKAVAAEDEAMKQIPWSELTKPIAEGDKKRDSIYEALNLMKDAALKYPDPDRQADAEKVDRFFKLYNVNTSAQYDRETGQIMQLIQDLESDCGQELQRLGLTSIVNELKAANDEVYRLLNERDILNSEKKSEAVKNARQRVDELYRALVHAINAFALVDTEGVFTPFINSLNTTIDRLNVQVLKIFGTASKPNDTTEEDEDGEDNDPDEGDDENEGGDPDEGSGDNNPQNPNPDSPTPDNPENPNPENPYPGTGGSTGGGSTLQPDPDDDDEIPEGDDPW